MAMVALKIFDVLIQAAYVYTVRISTDRNRDVIIVYIAAT